VNIFDPDKFPVLHALSGLSKEEQQAKVDGFSEKERATFEEEASRVLDILRPVLTKVEGVILAVAEKARQFFQKQYESMPEEVRRGLIKGGNEEE